MSADATSEMPARGWWREDYPEWDDETGWALTLPPPSVDEAHVGQHVAEGNTLRWSCHWLTNGVGGSAYTYSDLTYCLASVGAYVAMKRAAS